MSRFPRVTRGMGVLTAGVMNDLFDTVLRLEAEVEEFRRQRERPVFDKILAILTGYQLIGGNRYRYAWIEAIWSNSGEALIQKSGGQDSYNDDFVAEDPSDGTPFNAPAYNLIENGNEGLGWDSSVNVEGSAYPQTPGQRFYLQPIRGDDNTGGPSQTGDPGSDGFWAVDKGPGVMLRPVRDDTGALVYVFSVMNQHDGECSA